MAQQPMIIVRLHGNLGQQLAQYGIGLAASARTGVPLKLDPSACQTEDMPGFMLDSFVPLPEIASAKELEDAHANSERDTVLDTNWYMPCDRDDVSLRTLHLVGGLNVDDARLLNSISTCSSVALHMVRDTANTLPDHITLPRVYFDDAFIVPTHLRGNVAPRHICDYRLTKHLCQLIVSTIERSWQMCTAGAAKTTYVATVRCLGLPVQASRYATTRRSDLGMSG